MPSTTTRTYPNDPARCQMIIADKGQCINRSQYETAYCALHSAGAAAYITAKDSLAAYKLGKWRARTLEFADDGAIKSLRAEIGILRMTLDELLQRCQDVNELYINIPRINMLVQQIEKLVVSCNRLEASTGSLLDKGAAIQLAGRMIDIIGKFVTDPKITDQITAEFDAIFPKI